MLVHRIKQGGDFADHIARFGQAAGAEFAARHLAFIGHHHPHAAFGKPVHVTLGGFVLPHAHIHGRHTKHRLVRRQNQRGAKIISNAGRHLGHQVCCGGANHHKIRLAAKLDMANLSFVLQIPQAGMDLVARECCQRHRRDELRAAIGEHAGDIAPTPADKAHQFA